MMEFGMNCDSRIIEMTEWSFDIRKRKIGFLEQVALGKECLQSCLEAFDLNQEW